MNRTFALLCLVSFLLAGCAGTSGDDPGPAGASDEDPSDPVGGGNGTVARNVSLDDAPEYQLGEWWRVRVTEFFTGATYETTRVVAGVEDDNWLVGMPAETFSHEIMVMHVPGFGQVDRFDLGFEIHDALYIPLPFPLVEGDTWQTAFEGRAVTGSVNETSGTTARVEFHGASDTIVATYDAAIGEFSSWEASGYARVEVLEHGYDYEGVVTVPHQHDVIFINGRFAGGLDTSLTPAPPVEEIEVDATYQRVSFILATADLAEAGQPDAGYYSITATAPDGTEYSLTTLPGGSNGWTIDTYGHDDPGGTWSLQYEAVGAGFVFIEGIAYHVFDVVLPEGCLLPAEGEHEHGEHGCSA